MVMAHSRLAFNDPDQDAATGDVTPARACGQAARLRRLEDTWTNRTLHANQVLPLEPSGRVFHIQAKLSIPEGAKLRFNLRGVPVVLTSKTIESGAPPAC